MLLAAPIVVPLSMLAVLRAVPAADVAFADPTFHLIFATVITTCAVIVALAAARAGRRSAHHGPVWLAAGCVSVGLLMLSHGLLTPGVLGRPVNEWVGRTPYLALTLFAITLTLAARPRNVVSSRLAVAHPTFVLCSFVAVLTGLSLIIVLEPTALAGAAPVRHEWVIRWVLTAGNSIAFSAAALVHWRRWRLGRDPVQYALTFAGSMSMSAMVSLTAGRLWRLSWWDYHFLLVAGFGAAVYAVALRYRQTMAVDEVLAETFESDPMTHIVNGYPEALKKLVRRVEVKDSYTHGHSERTATVAVQLGLRLGIDDDALRAAARGGYLHDVGKIGVPDEILNKPGHLTDEERQVIETHPTIGSELVAPVPDLREVLPVVLHHHERWDGTGYPMGLASDEIPLVARIVAIADVWDALTSDRAYRLGMAPRAALAIIAAGRGTHFDPHLVDTFLGLAADWGYEATSADGDIDEGLLAAETCHDAVTSRA